MAVGYVPKALYLYPFLRPSIGAKMKAEDRNIFPIHDQLIPRAEKELLLNQKSMALWMTGLSGSGKSTLAKGLEQRLHALGFKTMVLDGDNVRAGLNSNLGFSAEDRMENIRRIAEVNALFLSAGIITINCFVSPTKDIRQLAKTIIGESFVEVYVNASLEACEQRDVKGLYQKARQGEIKNFTGISAPFEAPENPQIEINTEGKTAPESVQDLLEAILPLIKR